MESRALSGMVETSLTENFDLGTSRPSSSIACSSPGYLHTHDARKYVVSEDNRLKEVVKSL